MKTTRVNRTVLLTLGVLLLTGGIFGLTRGFGAFASLPADEPVLSDGMRAWVAHHHGLFWSGVAVLALLIAFLALVWLRQQLRATLPANQNLVRSGADGVTEVHSQDAATAVADQIGTWPGVEDATARLIGDPERPALLLRVGVASDADVAEVCRRVDAEALPDLKRCLELTEIDADLELRLRSPGGRLVR